MIEKPSEDNAVPWDPEMPWEKYLIIKASTYNVGKSFFKVEPTPHNHPDMDSDEQKVISPDNQWLYRERIIPRGSALRTYSGVKNGRIVFNDDVRMPMLYQKEHDYDGWQHSPWMSFTPMEHFTLRPGTRLAKGHTIVAGLGLGYQLEAVCKKSSVTQVTLIEKEKGLVDWLLPLMETHGKVKDVIIGDAEQLLPTMTADVALVDIYVRYGNNGQRLRQRCQNEPITIPKVWCWGAARF